MEAIGIENQPEALRSHLAVRCAKAALFLSRLKFPRNRSTVSTTFTEHQVSLSLSLSLSLHYCELITLFQGREMELSRTVEDLRRKLVRERLKNRRVKLCGVMELLLQMVLLLSLWTLCLMLALKFL
ncbi:hypothetical protein RHSIM_Rhsim06G0082400 [Rhododendron simsii]|uniref:Uncharacterized protein n=1 Tax=Rhododendron simsii TaxID=118357 RepID=A0A834LLI3_RHOSS|nr:hypothetical protein RHSIM_Rhsim06G0082400 [Rhododendron simsii]